MSKVAAELDADHLDLVGGEGSQKYLLVKALGRDQSVNISLAPGS